MGQPGQRESWDSLSTTKGGTVWAHPRMGQFEHSEGGGGLINWALRRMRQSEYGEQWNPANDGAK